MTTLNYCLNKPILFWWNYSIVLKAEVSSWGCLNHRRKLSSELLSQDEIWHILYWLLYLSLPFKRTQFWGAALLSWLFSSLLPSGMMKHAQNHFSISTQARFPHLICDYWCDTGLWGDGVLVCNDQCPTGSHLMPSHYHIFSMWWQQVHTSSYIVLIKQQ